MKYGNQALNHKTTTGISKSEEKSVKILCKDAILFNKNKKSEKDEHEKKEKETKSTKSRTDENYSKDITYNKGSNGNEWGANNYQTQQDSH